MSKLREAITSGAAVRVMEKMIEAQGGDPKVVADRSRLEVAKEIAEVRAPRSGFVADIDALAVGLTGVAMGAGRTRADQKVDPAVGIEIDAKPGDRVESGQVVARVFVRSSSSAAPFVERIAAAFSYADAAPGPAPLVIDRLSL
jgi:pyrimidine-nucleoside phosphorylase